MLPFEATWPDWLREMFGLDSFAPFHEEFWDWIWGIEPGVRPRPLVTIWPRGFGKSTSAETACVAVGATGRRRYGLYVSATQPQANTHVSNVAALLESTTVERHYPLLANRAINQYGASKGWRVNRLRTASGFTIDAIGLDAAARGIKIENQRPDFIVIDDIDNETDSVDAIARNVERITKAVLPAGSDDVAVLAVQNLVLPDGVFAQLAGLTREPAGFLSDRVVSGPHQAIEDLEVEPDPDQPGGHRIVSGTPVWEQFDLPAAQAEINTIGLVAFQAEMQHEVRQRGAFLFSPNWYADNRYDPRDPRITERVLFRIIAWDTAEEAHETAAFSAAAVLDVVEDLLHHGRYEGLLREIVKGHWLTYELNQQVTDLAERWRWSPDGRDVLRECWVEYASSGKGVVQSMRVSGSAWLRGRIKPAPARESKDLRLSVAATLAVSGRLRLPILCQETTGWLPDFEEELFSVPRSKRRDQTDAYAHVARAARPYLALGAA